MRIPLDPHQIGLLDGLISQHGLTTAKELIHQHSSQCIRMELSDECGDDAPIGVSRIGGTPDLTSLEAWPTRKDGSYCDFVLQVNLAEMPAIAGSPFPDQGLLSFFIDDEVSGPAWVATGRLVYDKDGGSRIKRIHNPIMKSSVSAEDALKAHFLRLVPRIDLECAWELLDKKIYKIVTDSDAWDRIHGLRESLRHSELEGVVGKLLGYSPTRSTLGEQAELVMRGDEDIVHSWQMEDSKFEQELSEILERNGAEFAGCVDAKWEKVRILRTQMEEFRVAAAQWRFLMQVESNYRVGLNIWDAWSYLCMMREHDLRTMNVDRAYFCVDQAWG
jgi:uncharacterized protein YwqG